MAFSISTVQFMYVSYFSHKRWLYCSWEMFSLRSCNVDQTQCGWDRKEPGLIFSQFIPEKAWTDYKIFYTQLKIHREISLDCRLERHGNLTFKGDVHF